MAVMELLYKVWNVDHYDYGYWMELDGEPVFVVVKCEFCGTMPPEREKKDD